MSIFNSPVAKRTRLQWQLFAQGFIGLDVGLECCGSSRFQFQNRNRVFGSSECGYEQEVHEVIDVDDYSIENRASKKVTLNEYCRSKRAEEEKSSEAKRVDKSLVDEPQEEKSSSENGSEGSRSTKRRLDESRETKTDEESLGDDESEVDISNENASEDSSMLFRRRQDEGEKVDVILLDGSEEEEEQNKENASEGSSKRHEEANNDNDDDDELCVDDLEDEINNENASEGSTMLETRRHEEGKLIDDDELFIDDSKEETTNENGSGGTSMSSNKHDEYSVDESEDKGSNEEESHHSMKDTDRDKENNNIESANHALKNHGYGSASLFINGTHTYFLDSSDDSDSDDPVVALDEEETDEDVQYHLEIQDQSSEDDEVESSSESESEIESVNWESLNFLLPNKRPNQSTNMKESPTKNASEKVCSGSVDRREKNHSVPKTNMRKPNLEPMNGTSMRTNTHEKTNASDLYSKVDKANAVKGQESLNKRSRGPRKDDADFVDSLLDSIIANEDTHHKEGDIVIDLPLRFRFDDSEDESSSQETDESDMKGLFQEMDFALRCEEIGSYKTPAVETSQKDDEEDIELDYYKLCQRGDHKDIYLEEQIGFRCGLCGAVILESRYVIPKLATYAPDRSKRSYLYDEQNLSMSNKVDFEGPNWNLDVYNDQSKGTVWELIPKETRADLYTHQQDGFKFLWENLAGTIELSKIQKLDPRGGGGCIISHAPGTGKTLLTIVFLGTFLKKFPNCCPVIVAPVSMLLTWEAEIEKWRKKWPVGFSFINLNSSEASTNEKVTNGWSKCNKDRIRGMKLISWSEGGSVLGVSYTLFEKLVGNTKNRTLEKMGNVLLDKPGLVVLDEGHTPRNQRSNIWNALKKLKTKKRVILSGTPFQNNFRELFNTLHLVRPTTWTEIMNQKIFSEMIHSKRKKSISGSASNDIEKLKAIISPFVHVHKGKILESNLPGLKSSVILLNPPPLQTRLIKSLGNLAKNFEYEHKVALVSVHPSLILCKENNSKDKDELEKVRLQPEFGVKTRFVMELIRLSGSLGEKVLIFSQYIEPLKLLKDQIDTGFGWNEGRTMVIEGRVNHKQRQTIIDNFNDPKSEVKVLLASTRCCSEGIHLIGGSRVVLLDVVWNPSVERQAISRAYRLGQDKVVYTYHLMASGTTEEEKYDRQVEKERLGELVFSSSAMNGEEPKKNKKANATKLNDKILQNMVDHQDLKNIFKGIR